MARISKEAMAWGNVTVLPTAAPRKVRQPQNRSGREARQALKEREPWPGQFLYPSEREAMERARQMASIAVTPELLLLSAICATLNDDQRCAVAIRLAFGVSIDSPPHLQAMAVLDTSRMTVGERVDFQNAQRRLQEGR